MSTAGPSQAQTPPGRRPGFLDSVLIFLLSIGLAVILLWAAARTLGLNTFDNLPEFLVRSYSAIWISVTAGATGGIGLAVLKRIKQSDNVPSPNYYLYTLGTTLFLLCVIGVLPVLFRSTPPASHPNPTPAPGPTPTPDESDVLVMRNSRDNLPYVLIPAGTFRMGCSPNDKECDCNEEPLHTVYITKAFWIGQTPVTQAAYERVTKKANPSDFKGPQNPVENVTWEEARDYCRAVGMRLPTEAEWEYAARAGDESSRYGEISVIAWYADNSALNSVRRTHEVATKQRNRWKLYDMLGNVWQWTNDWYDKDYYKQAPSQGPWQDPAGPTSPLIDYKVLRGGGPYTIDSDMRVSSRYKHHPNNRGDDVGFRCASNKLPDTL